MQLKHVAAAAVLALGAASASAAGLSFNASMGTLDESGESFGALGVGKGNFSYAYTFTLGTLSDLSGSLSALLNSVSFTGVTIGGSSVALSPSYSFSFEDLAAGDYTMVVSGKSKSALYAWGGSIVAQPVPEPQSVAMLLAGLGLMGAVAVRRRRFQ